MNKPGTPRVGQKIANVMKRAQYFVAEAPLDTAQKFNAVAGKAAKLGLMKPEDADIDRYVTGKALDGLYRMIAEEERRIRRDPIGTGSAILKKVFGAS